MSKGSGKGYGRGFASNADIFDKRGDPWISPRNQLEDFGRREYENPDLDRYTKASRADRPLDGIALEIKMIDQKKKYRLANEADKKAKAKDLRQRKMASILRRMNKVIK